MSQVNEGRQPVWCLVSLSDFTTEVEAGTPSAAGLLLDPELGLLLYLIPFTGDTKIHAQIVHALALRSKLSTEHNFTDPTSEEVDARGAWRVVIHWLVLESNRENWIQQITDVRKDTAFSEELSLDAIFWDGNDLDRQLTHHGFPRLLLATREVLKKGSHDEMARWMSANHLVKEALCSFAGSFRKPEQRDLAAEVAKVAETYVPPAADPAKAAPDSPGILHRIRVCNFRNLRDVTLDCGIETVNSRIVTGPNGTGKSSLCEAISLALFHSSFRYKRFADKEQERDIATTDRAKEYLEKYLRPLEEEETIPKIALGESELGSLVLQSDFEQISVSDAAMSGTILTQEMSFEFSRMPASELAVRILTGYSDLADHVEAYVDGQVSQATANRQSFLRNLSLNASITKLETAYERIARRQIDEELPPLPRNIVAWLEAIGGTNIPGAFELLRDWRSWGDDDSRGQLANEFSNQGNDTTRVRRFVSAWLNDYNGLIVRTDELLQSIKNKIASGQIEWEQVQSKLQIWGEWLQGRENTAQISPTPEIETLSKELERLQKEQQNVVEQGRLLSAHVEHLEQVEAFAKGTWLKEHPNECPTCGADHSNHGGILKVIDDWRAQTVIRRDISRKRFTSLKSDAQTIQRRLVELGQAQCPIRLEEQSELVEKVGWIVPESEGFAPWISMKQRRDALLNTITHLRQEPTIPGKIDSEAEAERLATQVLVKFREAELTFETPGNWKPVKEKLTQILSDIVKQHLPKTLEQLWCELVLNLTPAPWLLPERPCMSVATTRGEQRSTLRVKERLARYILNQSEVHILGLAWFFSRYMTFGRFYWSCMIMDDPSHELDQTGFRDLCRLWETFIRLHRVYHHPLSLVVMLNQETRAFDAARATGGIMVVLGWMRKQAELGRGLDVIGEGFFARQPTALLRKLSA